ncbi:MAG: FkbM family methyltransferase [Candidatus Omnitrophica bacterium]|nr:FkbM family methyltransferase [Candidatus Omnitrophota bacterium]
MLIDKLVLLKKVKLQRIADYWKLISALIKFEIIHHNRLIELPVNIDGLWFFLVDLESLLIVSPRYEAWLWNYLRPMKGDIFIDIGAHIGKYTLKVAKMVGEGGLVIAIEPVPHTFKALLKGIKLNKINNVIAFNIAAWNEEKVIPIYVVSEGTYNSQTGMLGFGQSSVKRKVGEKVEVQTRSIDRIVEELKLPRVNWIKCDVEGAEYEVLEGARNTIERFRPQLIVECVVNVKNCKKLLGELGYSYHKSSQLLLL